MLRADFLCQIDELLELEPGTLKGSEQLDSLDDWNSLAVIGYMAMVSEQNGVILSPKHIASCSTVEDLLRLAQAE